jgi:hypothetical protein
MAKVLVTRNKLHQLLTAPRIGPVTSPDQLGLADSAAALAPYRQDVLRRRGAQLTQPGHPSSGHAGL